MRIELAARPVLAGYPGHRRAETQGEDVFARAAVVEVGGARAILASLDVLLIPGELEEEILRRAGLPAGVCLLLTATHTHSGPGGTWDDQIAGWAGNGAFDRGQRDAIAAAMVEALRRAGASLRDATLQVAQTSFEDGPARPRSEGPLDPRLFALRLRRRGGPEIATVVGYAMHPTGVPKSERRISADWPGRAAAALERSGPALVMETAVGNTTWDREAGDVAANVARRALEVLEEARPLERTRLSCETRLLSLPRFELPPTFWLRTALANLLPVPERFAVQTRLQLDGLALIGVPGEPVGELGRRAAPAFLVGLADGYLGYVETGARWREGQGEARRANYGPGLARSLGLE